MRKNVIQYLMIYAASVFFAQITQAQTLNVDAPPAQEDATAAPSNGQTFGLWNVICIEKGKCIASTALAKKDAQGQAKKLVEVRVESIDGKRTIYVQLPTGIVVKPGVQLELGEATINLEYLMCGPAFCLASAEMTDQSLVDIKKAPDMKVVAVFAPNAKTKTPTKGAFKFSLDGSGAAIEALAQ